VVSFGERLKKEREKRGMTLEEVSAATKIGVRSLKALEQEKFDLLPGGIFNRGFVRSYAKHLGLDDEVVVADYMEAAGESTPAPTLADPTQANANEQARLQGSSPPLPWGSMAVVVAVAILLFAAWHYYSHRKPAEITNVSESSATAPEGSATTASPGPAPSDATSANTQASAPASTLPSANSSRVASAPASSAGSFALSLHAVDEVWLSTTVDAQPPSEAIMEQGQSKTLQASDKVVIRIGNPTALQVSINGKRIPIRGTEGQPETLTFTASGLQYAGGPPPSPN